MRSTGLKKDSSGSDVGKGLDRMTEDKGRMGYKSYTAHMTYRSYRRAAAKRGFSNSHDVDPDIGGAGPIE
jgi:hypothetical protein